MATYDFLDGVRWRIVLFRTFGNLRLLLRRSTKELFVVLDLGVTDLSLLPSCSSEDGVIVKSDFGEEELE